jgi:Lon protease-like protein
MLPSIIPLFPLPNVVLFPNVVLPLHIFEARYREMTADALKGDRIIGMVLLRPGWEGSYEGRPPIYDVGCAGVITHAEKLEDGRYNLVLRGMEKFSVLHEDYQRSYRRAEVRPIHEAVTDAKSSSTRWRSIWTSRSWKSRPCSSATGWSRAAGR